MKKLLNLWNEILAFLLMLLPIGLIWLINNNELYNLVSQIIINKSQQPNISPAEELSTITYTIGVFYLTFLISFFVPKVLKKEKSNKEEYINLLKDTDRSIWKNMLNILENKGKIESITLIKKTN